MKSEITRRRFLGKSAGGVAGVAGAATISGISGFASRKLETVRLGLIGCGGMMTSHVKRLVTGSYGASIDWLCDVDRNQIKRMSAVLNGTSMTPRHTGRYEDVIDDRDVDALIIATPHHWHAPIALAGMKEGKDVYIEKPISHVYSEGSLIIEASRKYSRIVQQGSQTRSSVIAERAGQLLADGIIGEVMIARAWTAEVRDLAPPVPDSDAPPGVDYDRWLGPAPVRPFNTHRFHRTWRRFQDYGNGEIGDDGSHDLDMAAWGLGVDSLPTQITARGGRIRLFGHDSEYPDNLNVTYEYSDGRLLIYENYPFASYGLHGFDNGNVFYGTEGYMIFSRRGAYRVFLGPREEPGPAEEDRSQRGYEEHMHNFLDCVRTRKPARTSAEVAHLSCALIHLGEIAYRTRGRLDFDPETEQFVGCEEANQLLTKRYRKPYGLTKT